MCGIAGKLALDPDALVDRHTVCAMTGALAHRGPEAGAHYFGPGIGLGYRQLAAVEGGRHPAQLPGSDDGTKVVGDFALTNQRELFVELRGLGHRVCTRAQADVVLHAYLAWGDRFVEHLRGTFACAVWDERQRRLLLVRDPLGVKPLVYSTNSHTLSFASEIKALLQDPDVERDCDAAAVQEYLALRYVPAPATVLSAVSKLPAGHMLVAQAGRVRVRQYWDLPAASDRDSPAARTERVAAALRDAVRAESHDSSDATLMLSGGASSLLVGSVLADTRSVPLVTVTAGIDEAPFTRVARARDAAKTIGSRHHTELSAPRRLPDFLPRLAWHLDEPCASPSALTTYLACAAARQHAPRVLAGHGGRYLASAAHASGLGGYPGRVRIVGGPGLRDVAPAMNTWRRVRRALTREFIEETAFRDPLDSLRALSAGSAQRDRYHRTRYVHLKAALPDDVLTCLDRASAAVSLDVRLPLLDRSLVESAALLPPSHDGWLQKLWHRALPPQWTQPDEERVEARVAVWLRGPLAATVSDVLLSGRCRHRGVFDHKAVTRLWQQHLTGRRDHHETLWSMLMLELWFEQFVDGTKAATRAA